MHDIKDITLLVSIMIFFLFELYQIDFYVVLKMIKDIYIYTRALFFLVKYVMKRLSSYIVFLLLVLLILLILKFPQEQFFFI